MPYYIPAPVSKTTCIGNTLSTFNISFTSLDTKLYELSTYTVNSVNFLSSTMISVSSVLNSRINFLSSAMISVSSVLNSRINFLSSAMISVSSDLVTQISNTSSNLVTQISNTSSNLVTQINYISSNLINEYTFQGNLYNNSEGSELIWDITQNGHNAYLPLTSTIKLGNPIGLNPGDSGNLSIKIGIVGKTLSAYGTLWSFNNSISSLTTTLSANNLISYYYNGEKILAALSRDF